VKLFYTNTVKKDVVCAQQAATFFAEVFGSLCLHLGHEVAKKNIGFYF
jgi:hypothetical protein